MYLIGEQAECLIALHGEIMHNSVCAALDLDSCNSSSIAITVMRNFTFICCHSKMVQAPRWQERHFVIMLNPCPCCLCFCLPAVHDPNEIWRLKELSHTNTTAFDGCR